MSDGQLVPTRPSGTRPSAPRSPLPPTATRAANYTSITWLQSARSSDPSSHPCGSGPPVALPMLNLPPPRAGRILLRPANRSFAAGNARLWSTTSLERRHWRGRLYSRLWEGLAQAKTEPLGAAGSAAVSLSQARRARPALARNARSGTLWRTLLSAAQSADALSPQQLARVTTLSAFGAA